MVDVQASNRNPKKNVEKSLSIHGIQTTQVPKPPLQLVHWWELTWVKVVPDGPAFFRIRVMRHNYGLDEDTSLGFIQDCLGVKTTSPTPLSQGFFSRWKSFGF